MQNILALTKDIKLVIFDVDGVLTDGNIIIDDNGKEYKAFNSRDGYGIKLLQYTGVKVGIITARTSKVVKYRMANLGINYVYQGQEIKLPAFKKIFNALNIKIEQCAYVGDDWIDISIMNRVGLAIAVQNADVLIKKQAHWITTSMGGKGAAREVCELIMEGQGTLRKQFEKHL